MPAKSEKQRRFMAAVANNPKFAKKTGVPQSVGEEFMKKSKNYMGGGMMKRYAKGGELEMVEKDGKMVPFYAADGKGKMMGGGKVMKYAEGDKVEGDPGFGLLTPDNVEKVRRSRDIGRRREEIIGGVGGAPGDEITRGIPMDFDDTPRPKRKPKPPKKPVKKMGGGMMKYNKGGKVRGCGMAKRGVRPAKMVKMKGA